MRRTLARFDMLSPGDRVLVGVSGGVDSMTLLHLLHQMAPELGIDISVAHLNHGLRGASADRDAERVRRAADAMGIPCHLGKAHVRRVKKGLGLSLEEAGRRVRYAFYNRVMTDGKYDKLALGHHRDDNAEQVLLALLRGTGPRGLSGIAPVRGRIVRPLFDAGRNAIDACARALEIPFARDASNDDLRFVRNRIRHRLLPHLAATYNPHILRHLARLAELVRTEEAWTEAFADAPFNDAVIRRQADALILSADALARAHPALARRLVRRALASLCGSLRRMTFDHVNMVVELARRRAGEKTLHLPGGLRVRRNGNQLTFRRFAGHGRPPATAPVEPAAPAMIGTPLPACITLSSMGVGLHFSHTAPDTLPAWKATSRHQAFFDADRLVLPLVLRPVHAGDRFAPLGTSGSQKLKKFFIDHHVSRSARATALVLTDQRRIVWLVGRRIADPVKVTPATTRVLGVEFFLLDT